MAAKKKPCGCNGVKMEKQPTYYVVPKSERMGTTKCAQSNAKEDIRSYITVYDEDKKLIIVSSDAKKAIPLIKEFGPENCIVVSGVPHCIPTPGHPCPKD